MDREDLKIVAAAVRYAGSIWVGRSHSGIKHRIKFAEGLSQLIIPEEDQGFVANDWLFYSRFQAGAIAFTAGQTKLWCEFLNSENLALWG